MMKLIFAAVSVSVSVSVSLSGCGLILDDRPADSGEALDADEADARDASVDASIDAPTLDARDDEDAVVTRDAFAETDTGLLVDAGIDAFAGHDAFASMDAGRDAFTPDAFVPSPDWSLTGEVDDIDVSASGDSVIIAGGAFGTIDLRYTRASGWVSRREAGLHSTIAASVENGPHPDPTMPVDYGLFAVAGVTHSWTTGAPVPRVPSSAQFLAGTRGWYASFGTAGLQLIGPAPTFTTGPVLTASTCAPVSWSIPATGINSLDIAASPDCYARVAVGVSYGGMRAVLYSASPVPMFDSPRLTLACLSADVRPAPGSTFGNDVALARQGEVLFTTSDDGPRFLAGGYRNTATGVPATSVALGSGVGTDVLLAWTDATGAYLQALPSGSSTPCAAPSLPLRLATAGATKVRISDCEGGELTAVVRSSTRVTVRRLECPIRVDSAP
jgi:hypothetical protein